MKAILVEVARLLDEAERELRLHHDEPTNMDECPTCDAHELLNEAERKLQEYMDAESMRAVRRVDNG